MILQQYVCDLKSFSIFKGLTNLLLEKDPRICEFSDTRRQENPKTKDSTKKKIYTLNYPRHIGLIKIFPTSQVREFKSDERTCETGDRRIEESKEDENLRIEDSRKQKLSIKSNLRE